MWSNDIECKYMFMFPLKNLARKGLKGSTDVCMLLQVGEIFYYILSYVWF